MGALASGCLTTELPNDTYVARRHACGSLESHSFLAPNGDRMVVLSDDTAYSIYERTNVDGTVTTGLVQCQSSATATLLFADAADTPSGRLDVDSFSFAQVTWRLER